MTSAVTPPLKPSLVSGDRCLIGRFAAMGCPCEILLDNADVRLGEAQLALAVREAERIEHKFSRYRQGNMVDRINQAGGARVEVDEETAALLDYAAECYAISKGRFDITTGILRKGPYLERIGWNRVVWERPFIRMPTGFEIDLGGICKEYAADRILGLLREHDGTSTLVNLGGDIAASGERTWAVGIENIAREGESSRILSLRMGGIATSGSTKRPGHIVDPESGRPVTQAPKSVTVAASTCTEAGFWSTLAMLQGAMAEMYLKEQGLRFWCSR